MAVALCVALCAAPFVLLERASAQFDTDFESFSITASEDGTVLTDQDDYYIPVAGSDDWKAYLYEGNALGFVTHPGGDSQFVAGVGPTSGLAARAQRNMTYGDGTGVWTVQFDVAVQFTGTLPAADYAGSISTQAYPGDATAILLLITYSDVSTAEGWDAALSHYDAGGVTSLIEDVPDDGFKNLLMNHWYRWTARFDLDTNEILDVTVEDLETSDSHTYEPSGWYLGGGTAGDTPPTGFRFFAGTSGSAVAIDNFHVLGDCNDNLIDDQIDIAEGTSLDCNLNTIPDECETGKLEETDSFEAADADLSDGFGNAVAMDGSTMVVGARLDDEAGTDTGAAYVFELEGDAWVQKQKLMPSDPEASDDFGYAVDIQGDVIAIGSRSDDTTVSNTGSVIVFRRSGSTWSQDQVLTASFSTVGDQLGASVAIDGSVIVAGAPFDDVAATNAGAVVVWRSNGSSYEEEAVVHAGDPNSLDNFGAAIDVSGYWLIVGASLDDEASAAAGAAYFYSNDGETWGNEQKVVADDVATTDAFGFAVAIEGNAAVIGSHFDDDAASNSGSAYVFRLNDGDWTQEQKLVAADADLDDELGSSVAIEADWVVVGAIGDGGGAGSVYLFACDGNAWTEQGRLSATGGMADDQLGYSVAISNAIIASGANLDDGAAADSGRVFVFSSRDCDGNGSLDVCEIATTPSLDGNGNGILDSCEDREAACKGDDVGEPPPPPPPVGAQFLRGDVNNDGAVSGLSDAIALLKYAFGGGAQPGCMDAVDVDGNNAFSGLQDTLYLLRYSFSSGTPPPAPGPSTCGVDPDDDATMTCLTEPAICQ